MEYLPVLPWEPTRTEGLRRVRDFTPRAGRAYAEGRNFDHGPGDQTRGKTYLARPENIARYTSGRFHPHEGLVETAEAVEGPPPPRPRPLPRAESVGEGSLGLLLIDEDLDPASLGLEPARVAAVAGVLETSRRSPLPVGELATAFASGAMDDALRRACAAFAQSTERFDRENWHEQIMAWASRHSLQQVVTPYAPQGPTRERLDPLRESLGREGVTLSMIRRPWDELFWPLATSGFFPFKETIPACLERLGLVS
jgi:deoxyribodipyrimidine photo-lyase